MEKLKKYFVEKLKYKMTLKMLLMLMVLFISFNGYTKIILNTCIVYKKGIDKGLVLVSEYHSVEEVDNYGMASLKIKDELEILLTASFIDDNQFYGPSNLIKIDGQLILRKKIVQNSFFNKGIHIPLGVSQTLIYQNDTGHMVELSITPEVR